MFKLKPITLVQVPAGRVESSTACTKTVLNRTRVLSAVRGITSCSDNTSQLAAEVKALSKVERQSLLEQAQLPISVPANDALAMKADLSMPWNKLRVLRR